MERTYANLSAVVLDQVLVDGAEQDHGEHAAEEEHNDERVEDAEPLDLGVLHRVEDVVPTRGPLDRVVLAVADRVRVVDVDLLAGDGGHLGRHVAVAVLLGALDLHLGVDDAAALVQERRAPLLVGAAVIGDLEVDMVEQVVRLALGEQRLYSNGDSDDESIQAREREKTNILRNLMTTWKNK